MYLEQPIDYDYYDYAIGSDRVLGGDQRPWW